MKRDLRTRERKTNINENRKLLEGCCEGFSKVTQQWKTCKKKKGDEGQKEAERNNSIRESKEWIEAERGRRDETKK